MTGYELPLAAFRRERVAKTSPHDKQEYTWHGVTIVHWTSDADHEPVAVYIDNETGVVGYSYVSEFEVRR